jgi:hypothetical protein
MLSLTPIGLPVEDDEMKGFSRTIAEIEWLLLILVLVYLVAGSPPYSGSVAIQTALFFFGAFILGLHYVHFYKQETLVKLAAESWIMVGFVTWVVWFSGRLHSPLLYFYLLPVVASALIFAATEKSDGPIDVLVRGGDTLQVDFERAGDQFAQVTLTGPADFVFDGTIEI